MSCHISLWQFHANGENTDGKDYSCHFQRNFIVDFRVSVAPAARIEYVRAIWSYISSGSSGRGQDMVHRMLTDDNSK